MFFSTVVLNGANTPLMHPEMQFRRIVFSTFCPRASFHTAWVIRDRSFAALPDAKVRVGPIATHFCGAAKYRDVPNRDSFYASVGA
jgi:hypothetical protein